MQKYAILSLSYLCKLPRWNFLKKQDWKAGMNKDEGSQTAGATAGEKASASPVQLLSPAAPRRRLFQFQDGEEQGGFPEKLQKIFACLTWKSLLHHHWSHQPLA